MYLEILNGLFASNNLTTDQAKQTYLQNLKPAVQSLRASYRAFPVRFDYANHSVQAAYLLAYFPHYTDLLLTALNKTEAVFANQNISELHLFGSGPCPEILGFLRYATQHTPRVNRDIQVTIYDIAVEHWRYSRDIIYGHVVPTFLNGSTVHRSAGQIDISQHFTKNFTAGSKLCVFQNCLNEISEANHGTLIQNFRNVYSSLPSGSYLAIIDLDYRQIRELIANIENALTQNPCQVLRSIAEGEIRHRSHWGSPPQIITDNLLTDIPGQENPTGLLPRRNIPFIYSLYRKP